MFKLIFKDGEIIEDSSKLLKLDYFKSNNNFENENNQFLLYNSEIGLKIS